jgi:hypothetical protein
MPVTSAAGTERLASQAGRLAGTLKAPAVCPPGEPWLAQSLSAGTAGTALLHVERARSGQGTWQQAHAWITAAASGEISAAATAGLYLGLPALTFLLDTASVGGRYSGALADTDHHLKRLALSRVADATDRIRSGQAPGFREYDTFSGLTGIGALLLRRDPAGSTMEQVLGYLVALTHPRAADGGKVPGWWAGHDPRSRKSRHYPGGHGNFGAAHGIAGPLALLSHAERRGVTIGGQREAISGILAFLDAWRQESPAGPWWPEWITMADLWAGRPGQRRPNRPSWCYGTPGIARAGQLASIALSDADSQRRYEQALAACVRDPAQLAQIIDPGLCHGAAGLYMTAWRAAQDALSPCITPLLPVIAGRLRDLADGTADGPGLLNGAAGTALALYAASGVTPISGWDACLLIS